MHGRTIAWTAVFAGHLLVIWFVGHETEGRVPPRPRIEPMVMISMAPVIRGPVTTGFPVQFLPAGPIASDLPILGDMVEPTVFPQSSGRTTPPRPSDAQSISTSEFAGISGLLKGSGATVVLRVEVHGNGVVGRVEVDVSGGSRKVDQAAIAFVRGLKWVGGCVDDKPETLWIRWGVRLDG
jgi:TonB family protein